MDSRIPDLVRSNYFRPDFCEECGCPLSPGHQSWCAAHPQHNPPVKDPDDADKVKVRRDQNYRNTKQFRRKHPRKASNQNRVDDLRRRQRKGEFLPFVVECADSPGPLWLLSSLSYRGLVKAPRRLFRGVSLPCEVPPEVASIVRELLPRYRGVSNLVKNANISNLQVYGLRPSFDAWERHLAEYAPWFARVGAVLLAFLDREQPDFLEQSRITSRPRNDLYHAWGIAWQSLADELDAYKDQMEKEIAPSTTEPPTSQNPGEVIPAGVPKT